MARKWWTLLLSSLATFMLLLDITVVNVALLIGAIVSFLGAALGFALVRASDFVAPTEAVPEPAAA